MPRSESGFGLCIPIWRHIGESGKPARGGGGGGLVWAMPGSWGGHGFREGDTGKMPPPPLPPGAYAVRMPCMCCRGLILSFGQPPCWSWDMQLDAPQEFLEFLVSFSSLVG